MKLLSLFKSEGTIGKLRIIVRRVQQAFIHSVISLYLILKAQLWNQTDCIQVENISIVDQV